MEPVLFTHRNSFPVLMFAVVDQMSMAPLTHAEPERFARGHLFPTKSTMASAPLVVANAPSQANQFRASQTATEKQRQHRKVSLAPDRVSGRNAEKRFSLLASKPVSSRTPSFLGPLTRRMLAASSG